MFRILVCLLCALVLSLVLVPNAIAEKTIKCGNMKWTDKGHDDNKPSSKKGESLIKSGADVCEVAKQCDHMQIDVSIKNKKELDSTPFYQNAPAEIQKELDEYANHGHGHDNPNIVCYEVEEAVFDSQ